MFRPNTYRPTPPTGFPPEWLGFQRPTIFQSIMYSIRHELWEMKRLYYQVYWRLHKNPWGFPFDETK